MSEQPTDPESAFPKSPASMTSEERRARLQAIQQTLDASGYDHEESMRKAKRMLAKVGAERQAEKRKKVEEYYGDDIRDDERYSNGELILMSDIFTNFWAAIYENRPKE